MQDLEGLAAWSPWMPFGEAIEHAPSEPGVYIARELPTCAIVYVGMAGERAGGSGKPKGVRGRLRVYASGKGLASGLGEAAFDRALADATWLRTRLAEVEGGHVARAKVWGRLALERSQLELSWSTTVDRSAARKLEIEVLTALADAELWNRAR